MKTDYSKILKGGDNIPTDKEKWGRAVAAAKQKFAVYPSAVANAWAAKKYADEGGKWKSMADGGEVTITPAEMALQRRGLHDQPFFTDLAAAAPHRKPKQGEKPKKQMKPIEQEQKPEGSPAEPPTPEEMLQGGPLEESAGGGEHTAEIVEIGDELRSIAEGTGQADGGMIGSMSALTTAIGKQQESPFPEVVQFAAPDVDVNKPAAKIKQPEALAEGGLVVTRSSDRKGKTHKVVDKKTGETHYFGDAELGQHPKDPKRKAAFYARHKENLANNRFFRAFARATWADGGVIGYADGTEDVGGEGDLSTLPAGAYEGESYSDYVRRLAQEEEAKRAAAAAAAPQPLQPVRTYEEEVRDVAAENAARAKAASLAGPIPETEAAMRSKAAAESEQEAAEEATRKAFRAEAAKNPALSPDVKRALALIQNAGREVPAGATSLESRVEAAKLEGLQSELQSEEADPKDLAKTEELRGKIKGLKYLTAKDYKSQKEDIDEEIKKLPADLRSSLDKEFGEVDKVRSGAEDLVRPREPEPFRPARGPLAVLRGEVSKADKYGKEYGTKGYSQYQDFYKRAYEQLGGEIPLTGKENEAERANIMERNRFRREAADKVAAEMMTSFGKKETPAAPAAAGEVPAEGSAVEPKPAVRASTPEATGAVAPQKGAIEPVGATIPATPDLAKPEPTGATDIQSALQAQINLREEEQKRLAAAAKGQAVQRGTASGLATALQGLTKADKTPIDLSKPQDRYSPEVVAVVSKLGDFDLVKKVMVAEGISDVKDGTGTSPADRVAIDEVLRGVKVGEATTQPTGVEAMEIARQSPEYQQAALAAQTQAQIALEDAKLKAKQEQITNQIRTAQIDLDLKLAQDYQIKKRALEQQTTELRRQINNQTIKPQQLFVSGENLGMSILIAGLDLLGSGLGSKDSIMDFVQRKIDSDLNAQVGMLNQKRTILGDLIKQGNDIDDAYKLSDAFYKKVFALEIERNVSGIANDRTRLAGFAAAQKLLLDAAKTEDDILKKQADVIREFATNRLNAAAGGVKSAAEWARILASLENARSRVAAAGKRAKEKGAIDEWKREGPPEAQPFLEGKSINPATWSKVIRWKPELTKMTVKQFTDSKFTGTLPDGRKVSFDTITPVTNALQMAISPEDKKEVDLIDQDASRFLSTLNELQLLAEKHNYTGFTGWTGADAKADQGRAEKLEGELAAALGGKSQYNVGVPQEAEYRRLKDAIPKASEYSTGSYSKAKFDQFRRDLIRNIKAIRNDRLVGGFDTAGTAPSMPPPTTKR